MRRAVGDAAGLTIKAQVQQAARNLGYPDDDWRVREAWYGRAGAWSAAALDELRQRFAACRETERVRVDPTALAERVAAVRRCLDRASTASRARSTSLRPRSAAGERYGRGRPTLLSMLFPIGISGKQKEG